MDVGARTLIRGGRAPGWLPVVLASAGVVVLATGAAAILSRDTRPADARDAVSIVPDTAERAVPAAHDAAYAIRPGRQGALIARASGEGLRARFDAHGAVIDAPGGVRLGLEPLAVVRGAETVRVLAPVAPRAHGNRVTYRHGPVTEWYANRPRGIEHGLDLARRPGGSTPAKPVRIVLRVRGGLTGTVQPGRHAIAFSPEEGGTPLVYRGLSVRDASGRPLPSRLSLSGKRMTVSVNDRSAVYPLHVDPVFQAPGGARATRPAAMARAVGDAARRRES